MSLTGFLQVREVKDRFRTQFKKPAVTRKMILQAKPLTNNYSLVGSAFDYLLRFYLENNNPSIKKSDVWLAEISLSILDTWTKRGQISESKFQSIKKIVETAKERHKKYLMTGVMTDELISSSIQLARLEMVYRIGLLSDYIESVRSEDVEDLKKMISLINPDHFKVTSLCVLNPTFGVTSIAIGGADADLILDDALIEIKTTINPKFERDYFNQLIGYLVLKRISELKILVLSQDAEKNNNILPKKETYDFSSITGHRINKIGVYFSRYGVMQTIDIRSITNNGEFDEEFIDWFLTMGGIPDADAE
jgi:hypothetical protein